MKRKLFRLHERETRWLTQTYRNFPKTVNAQTVLTTEMKQKRNGFETVLKLFRVSFISICPTVLGFRCGLFFSSYPGMMTAARTNCNLERARTAKKFNAKCKKPFEKMSTFLNNIY